MDHDVRGVARALVPFGGGPTQMRLTLPDIDVRDTDFRLSSASAQTSVQYKAMPRPANPSAYMLTLLFQVKGSEAANSPYSASSEMNFSWSFTKSSKPDGEPSNIESNWSRPP